MLHIIVTHAYIFIIENVNFEQNKIIEKIVSVENPVSKKSVSVKIEKPLIDLPSQRENVMFKTSQSKTLEVVEQIFSMNKTIQG